MKKVIIPFIILFLLFSVFGTGGKARPFQHLALAQAEINQPPIQGGGVEKIAPDVQEKMAALPSGEIMTVIVTLRDQADLSQIPGSNRAERLSAVIQTLQAKTNQSQKPLRSLLAARMAQGAVSQFTPLWINNSISVSATAEAIQELAVRGDVMQISLDEIDIEQTVQGPAEPNISVINAPSLWNLGLYGQGVVVANMDSGVDVSHPDLFSSWRGGSNSWFDPYGQHPTTPTDMSGHGTWTMGVMVGGDANGTTIGTAPQAQWIAVKIFNDSGASTATAIHLGFQWVLDPDGNPTTDDAPQVVNNSWTLGAPGCDLAFQPDLQALRAAGIVPVFAAGNYGPGSSTSRSPANYPEALAVGATNNSDVLYALSSRGPSTCDGSVYPELVAPGVNVKTSDLFGFYTAQTGTSLAAPHVSGALALLLSAYPNLSVTQQENALTYTAVDLGIPGPDNDYGNGRVDVLAAYQWLVNGGGSDPTATPVPPTPTPAPPTTTPIPPTATPAPPTATPAPPTATPAPPTATPIPPTPTTVPNNLIFADGFESGDFSAWTAVGDRDGDLFVSSIAAMVGSNGMVAPINDRRGMHVRDESPQSESHYRASFYFDPNSVSMGSGNQHRILTARTGGTDVIRLDFRYSNGEYEVRSSLRTDAGKYTYTSWYAISDAPNLIEVDWQASASAGANDGYLSLWLDNVLMETCSGIDNDTLRVDEVRLGPSTGIDSATSGTEFFDEFVSSSTADSPIATPIPPTATLEPPTATPIPPTATLEPPTATPVLPTATLEPPTATPVLPTATLEPPTATPVLPTATPAPPTATPIPPTPIPPTPTTIPNSLIFADGFESGDLSAWTAVGDRDGDLSVSSIAAMVGSNGMAASINDRRGMYVRDETPQSESHYRASFYFDPNGVSMGSGNQHRILTARMGSVDVIRLDFGYIDGQYQVRGSLRTDAGKNTYTSWHAISDAPNLIEVDWQASASAGANDGYLSLWFDNILKETRSGIDNDTLRVDEVRLGPATGIDSATSGTELFDDFVSVRTSR